MSIFDKLKNQTMPETDKVAGAAGEGRKTFTFQALPESLAEMQAMTEAELSDPFQTAALTLCALCAYAADKQIGTEMLNWLRGPRPLSNQEISFLNDRFRGGKTYIPFSYFEGAVPDNNYTPKEPFQVTFYTNAYSDANEGYKKLFVDCGGADGPRSVVLRMRGDGKWFLWEQYLLVDIRTPKAADPWA